MPRGKTNSTTKVIVRTQAIYLAEYDLRRSLQPRAIEIQQMIMTLGTGHYLWPEVAPERIIFLRKFFPTQLNFVSEMFLPMQQKPIIFLYPTNYSKFRNGCQL